MRVRLLLSCLALVAAAVVAVLLLAFPMLHASRPLPVALVLLYLGIGLALRLPRQTPGWAILWPLAAALVLLPFAIVARGFGRVDMMAFLFHTQLGVDGGSVMTLSEEITIISVATLVFLVATWFLLSILRPLGGMSRPVLPVAIAVLVGINPLAAHAVRAVIDPVPELPLIEAMVTPVPTSRPEVLPDIVYIYLEGLDRRFTDPALAGDAYDPLHELADEGLNLTNIGQINGTTWSLAGMVASQCGVPLLPRGLLNIDSLSAVTDFLPGITCLSDILAGHGYAMEYVVGGEEDFGGIESFYRSHGVAEIWGKARQIRLHPAEDVAPAFLGWVLDDEMVYDSSRIRFQALVDQPAPFILFVETIGPHGSTGTLSRSCTENGRAAYSDDHARVVRCLADLTLGFVRDIQAAHAAAGRTAPLRIVVQSDHLFHSLNEVYSTEDLERNTVILLGGPEHGEINDRPGSMVDVYPTLLDWMGFGVTSAGLGRSVLGQGGGETLVQRHGLEPFSAALLGATDLATLLWDGST